MDVKLIPHALSGEVTPPVSKSSLHRLLLCAALGDRPVEVRFGGAVSDDIAATVRCLTGLGASLTETEHGLAVTPLKRDGAPSKEPLDCGESGSTLRFMLPVAAALGGEHRFLLRGRLPERPLSPLKEELLRHGAHIGLCGNILTVCGDGMRGGEFAVDGSVSSQFISGLLFMLPLMREESTVRITGRTESRPYIDMTVHALNSFGFSVTEDEGVLRLGERGDTPRYVCAERDWSGASFWVCAGALSPEGILCRGLDRDSLQGDRRCVDIVRRMGAETEWRSDGVFVRRGSLSGVRVSAEDIPDLVPVLCALAAAAEGDTEITGAARLRLKESDRIESTCRMIDALGGSSEGGGDGITVHGGGTLFPRGAVDSAGDHRIAMAAAILSSAVRDEVTVAGAECVGKSYPDFWKDYASLGGEVIYTNDRI